MLFGAGDLLAQTATMERGGKYDVPRLTRAAVFGTFLLGPLAHVHFNFIEWLVVKRVRATVTYCVHIHCMESPFGQEISPLQLWNG